MIHAAFKHDFSTFAQNCEDDRRAIEAIGGVLEGSGRPLVVTEGISPTPGRASTQDDVPAHIGMLRGYRALAWAVRGVRATVVRLPQVHNCDKAGLVTYSIAVAPENGISAPASTAAPRCIASMQRPSSG